MLDLCELFAGCAQMARTFEQSGKPAGFADKLYGPGMDILTSSGFGCLGLYLKAFACLSDAMECQIQMLRTYLAAALTLGGPRAVAWLGVCCSSWVQTSRATTRRMYCSGEGQAKYKSVEDANLMASRTIAPAAKVVAYPGMANMNCTSL